MKTDKKGNSLPLSGAETITSRQNPTVVNTAKLGDKKYREAKGLFLLDGIKLALEAMSSVLTVEYILMTEAAAEKYSARLGEVDPCVRAFILSEPAFDRVTDERSPEGIVTVVRYSDTVRRAYSGVNGLGDGCRLILDGVQSPENFGAVLRSARAFGMTDVICGAGCADVYGRRVMRASMGAALHVGTLYADSAAAVCRELASRGRRVIATVPRDGAEELGEFEFMPGDVIVIGNEGHGISREAEDEATVCVRIPMAEGQESLNAACAASVLLWELYRNVKGKGETSPGL